MSEKNCRDLAKEPDVDGFLVGGASLKPACECSFLQDNILDVLVANWLFLVVDIINARL